MSADLGQQPSPGWRAAQHRIRNDLQTLAALMRLSRRRAPDSEIVELYPDWLSALAALYDAMPLWDERNELPLADIARALIARMQFNRQIRIEGDGDAQVAVASALAASLSLQGLLTFSCRNAAPGGTVRVNLSTDTDALRAEAIFPPAAEAGTTDSGKTDAAADSTPAGWPPLSLALAAEALDGRYAVGAAGNDTVAVLLIPRR